MRGELQSCLTLLQSGQSALALRQSERKRPPGKRYLRQNEIELPESEEELWRSPLGLSRFERAASTNEGESPPRERRMTTARNVRRRGDGVAPNVELGSSSPCWRGARSCTREVQGKNSRHRAEATRVSCAMNPRNMSLTSFTSSADRSKYSWTLCISPKA